MMNNNVNKKQLLNWIDIISFATVEASLYLDTHPTDMEAKKYFSHFMKLRNEALEEYCERFTPLTMDCVKDEDNYWKWVTDKWPWEKGGC